MKPERYRELVSGRSNQLTDEEFADGWHFCDELDWALLPPQQAPCRFCGYHVLQLDGAVELKTAYHWHCAACSAVNFALPEKVEMTDADREAAYREFHGLGAWESLPSGWEDFEVVCIPPYVKCNGCRGLFATRDERA